MEHDGQDQVALMQHLVVLQVVHEGLRHGFRVGDCVNDRARHPVQGVGGQRHDDGQQLAAMVSQLAD